MGYFDGIGDASMGPERIYFPPGFVGRVRCERVEVKAGRKGDHYFVAEFRILESNITDRPAGSKATWVFNMKHDAALGNVKKLLAALSGIPLRGPDGQPHPRLSEITPDVCAYAVSEDQPMAGTEARLSTAQVPTKAGGAFTAHNWEPA